MNKKSKGKASLSEKIASVLNATPSNFESDNESEDGAPLPEFEENVEIREVEEFTSKIRKQNVDLLDKVDSRYAGKKSSRKKAEFESDDDEDVAMEEDDESSQDEEESEAEEDEFGESEEESEDDDNFKHLNDVDSPAEMSKGIHVRNQLHIWEKILEMRIQMQKCMSAANKMPQKEVYKEMKSSEEFSNKVEETQKSVSLVLGKLLDLHKVCIAKFPESKKVLKGKVEEIVSDEEIPSDTEDEKEESEEEVDEPLKKKQKLTPVKDMVDVFEKYKPYRNNVIQKWNEKTNIVVAKNAGTQSVLKQIEHNLSDREKLIKRTQVKRTDYRILGKEIPENEEGQIKDSEDANIFDDNDFYHQLLRELIEVKSADLTDPVQLGRQWIQLQNLRSKMKKKVDTRATKGRKIRYTIHTKMVNFMAPIDEHEWTDEAKTELYNSLFGKRQISHQM
ncbi:PREDICTED: protein AATF-like [Nicrophorus vespilloides]|uniref:Protein AATF-like n=1 Tax=Nicrophorus vespilloides TaxID=110193 RepID=A0ABM1MAR6_NICVS|nr:PREDICTED: protein AATF-like [Nicrophorus vespilloides]